MDDATLNLIALAFFALLGGGIFILVRRSQAENEQKIAKMAAENHWTFEPIREPLVWGMRLKSTRWTLEALSCSNGPDAAPGSSNLEMSSTWHANAPGSTLLIGPRASQTGLGNTGEILIHQVLMLALGAEAIGLNEMQTGSAALRQKYLLLAQQPTDLENLLTPEVENALLAWKDPPVLVKRTSSGLGVELHGVRLNTVAELRALIKLGELILESSNLKGVSS